MAIERSGWWAAWALLGMLAQGAVVRAQPQPQGERIEAVSYRYDPSVDLTLTVALGVLGGASVVVDHELPGPAAGDASRVFILDRGVAERAQARAGARTASDVMLFSVAGLGALASAFSVDPGRFPERTSLRRQRWIRTGLFVESLAVTNAVTTVVKLAVARPRPYTYAAGYDATTARHDDGLSYFSGHTSIVAATSSTLAYLAFVEAPGSARAYATLGAGVVATSTVATLRIRAGKHFPTDVLTGAIVGAAIGTLVPHLHRRTQLSISADASASGGMVFVGGFL